MEAAVRLEPLQESHAMATLGWVEDPRIAADIGLSRVPTEAGTASFIERSATDPALAAFAITVDGVHTGNVVIDLIDEVLGTARLSIYIGDAEARGRGVGRRATRLALAHSFGALGLNKVWLIVHERNSAAIRAYEASGFTLEGTLREEFLLDGERVDALRMGMLAREFESS